MIRVGVERRQVQWQVNCAVAIKIDTVSLPTIQEPVAVAVGADLEADQNRWLIGLPIAGGTVDGLPVSGVVVTGSFLLDSFEQAANSNTVKASRRVKSFTFILHICLIALLTMIASLISCN